MARKSEIVGMKELERAMKRIGKVPQTVVTKAARAGATIAHKAAKADAPVDTGDLKSGIIMKREKRTKIGKTMYDIMMSPYLNDTFVKETKSGIRYYYPASQEYGFITVDGGYVQGLHFFRQSITNNVVAIETRVVSVAAKAIDKAWEAR